MDKLAWYELYCNPHDTIARGKQIKKWETWSHAAPPTITYSTYLLASDVSVTLYHVYLPFVNLVLRGPYRPRHFGGSTTCPCALKRSRRAWMGTSATGHLRRMARWAATPAAWPSAIQVGSIRTEE